MRFQNPQTPHLTLMFWPEVSELEYQGIVEQCEKIAAESHPFPITVLGVDTFGSRGRDQTLFLSVAFSPELAELRKRCPWTDKRPFHPHITLANIKHPERFGVEKKRVMKALKHVHFSMTVDRVRLYAEVEGRKQTPTEEFQFTKFETRNTKLEGSEE